MKYHVKVRSKWDNGYRIISETTDLTASPMTPTEDAALESEEAVRLLNAATDQWLADKKKCSFSHPHMVRAI